ncbi:Anti-sigma-E factor ChrR [Zhongshania aliphaticivorans]|uniref:Anti-sigma-E factor ChrR n=1 Tax=Zhongshania aliphaticivorans TaxID=1470434 RepID=A0A5S9NM02_9GAMM|nr:ChrR family anti-sigma-E factor [Zhongshania aliphaticivorans]CAA0091324.1 Anti-sigma-E factor ChrR [Zhongshania aliphaticivorans]CAA0098732.1 Anti-sigma-E factor ChrR [Zhongshania aliphaticivorans]
MSGIEHHPNEETLLSYSAGSLPAALALVVGSHLEFCAECRAKVREGESLGGELMSAMAPQALSERARLNVLQQLEVQSAPIATQAVGRVEVVGDNSQGQMPSLLRKMLNESDFDKLPWKKTIAPGLKQVVIDCGEGNARLLRIAAGQRMPVHSHRRSELTMILSGGYSDKLGQFNAGDVADLDGSVEHQPIADDDMDCICLAGMDAPLVFKGWLAKLVQPFVGM